MTLGNWLSSAASAPLTGTQRAAHLESDLITPPPPHLGQAAGDSHLRSRAPASRLGKVGGSPSRACCEDCRLFEILNVFFLTVFGWLAVKAL